MFVFFAILIVCPVWTLNEINNLAGWRFDWRHVLWLEGILISILLISTILLMRVYSEMHWFESLGPILCVGVLRVIYWIMQQLFVDEFSDD